MITVGYASGAVGVHAYDEVHDNNLRADANSANDNKSGNFSFIADGFYHSSVGMWTPSESRSDNSNSTPNSGTSSSLSASNAAQDVLDDPKWWDEQAESFLRKQFYGHGTRRARATRADGSPGPQYDIKKRHAYKDSSTGFYHYTAVEEFDGLPITNSRSWVHLDTKGDPYYGQNGFFHSDKNSNQTYQFHKTALRALEDKAQNTAGGGEISASDAVYAYAKAKGFNAHLPQNMVEYPSEDRTEKNGKVSVLGSGISYGKIDAEKVYYNDQKKGLVKVWQIDVTGPLANERIMVEAENGEVIAAASSFSPTSDPLRISPKDYSGIGDEKKVEALISIASPELLLWNSESAKGEMQQIYDSDAKNIGPIREMVDTYNKQASAQASTGASASISASNPTNVSLPKLEDLSYGGFLGSSYTSELASRISNKKTEEEKTSRSSTGSSLALGSGNSKIPDIHARDDKNKAALETPGNSDSAVLAGNDTNINTGGVPKSAGFSIKLTDGSVNKYNTVNGGVDALYLAKIQGSRNFDYMYVPKNTLSSPNGWLYSEGGSDANATNSGGGYATVGSNVIARSRYGNESTSRASTGGRLAYSPPNNKNAEGGLLVQSLDTNEQRDATAKFVGSPISGYNTDSEENAASGLVNAFVTANQFHDIMSLYGFDENSGNFQDKSVAGGGKNGDPILIMTRGPDDRNNSNFRSNADGTPSLLRTYLYDSSNPSGVADGSFDQDIIVHELTHGLTHRLSGSVDDANFCSDNTPIAENAAMMISSYDEGTSDAFGLLWSISPNDNRNTRRRFAEETKKIYDGRPLPFTTDTNINNYSYGNYCLVGNPAVCEAHANGLIWASALYDATWNLIDAEGFEPSLANVNSNKGNVHMLKYLVEGIKIQPCAPTFITARNSIIAAENMVTGGKNKCHLWRAFAKRGIGVNAKEPEQTNNNGVNNFDLPPECRNAPS